MLKCNHCGNACVEAGFQKTKVQPYKCKGCNKYCQLNYSYLSYTISDKKICRLVKESCGIHSIARIAEISPSTVLRRIRKIASTLFPPKLYTKNKEYEVDEMRTFVKKKTNACWITYAIERETKTIIDFRIGARSTNKINQVIQSVIFRYTKSIFTDGYCIYKNVIPSSLYKLKRYGTNIIERMNLNLRTHLKRLCRRTISFTRKRDMLEASLKIYFWG